ncbi:MAG: lytic transglycosylase domain-containing protein, partial [Pseudomonadota bacterium]
MRSRLKPLFLALALVSSPANAEAPSTAQAGGDFTFKRVGVPDGGAGKRITVQIDPDAEVFRITPGAEPRRPGDPRPEAALQLPPGVPGAAGPSAFDWYWQAVSPAQDVDPALRFNQAMQILQQNALKVGTPRLSSLQSIVQDHGVDILTATIGTEVSPALVVAVISVESAGQNAAVSHAGAQGLMQLIPATAERFGVSDSFNAKQNIEGG